MTRLFAILAVNIVLLVGGLARAQHVDYSQLRCVENNFYPAFDRNAQLVQGYCYNPDGQLRGESFRLIGPGATYQTITATGQSMAIFENRYGSAICRRDPKATQWVICVDARGQELGRIEVAIPASHLQ